MRKSFLAALLALAVSPPWAGAEPPKVAHLITAKVGELVAFDVTVEAGKELGYTATFDTLKDCTLVRLYSDEPNVYKFMAQPKVPGFLYVAWWTVGDKKGTTTALGGDPVQPPDPAPDDGKGRPQPAPGPTASHVYMAIIRDPSSVTPAQARLLGDTAFWDGFKAAGHEWDSYSNTSPELIRLKYLPLAQKVQTGTAWTNVLILLDKETGRPLKTIALPDAKDGVSAALKEVTK